MDTIEAIALWFSIRCSREKYTTSAVFLVYVVHSFNYVLFYFMDFVLY